jgi:hypothetical protein
MTYRDPRCRCCPSLNSFRAGRAIVCVSPFPQLGPPGARVTTTEFAAPSISAVVTPSSEAAHRAPESNPSPSQLTGMLSDVANAGGEHETVTPLFESDTIIDDLESGTSPGVCGPEREMVGTTDSELMCVGPSLIRDLDARRSRRTDCGPIDPIGRDPVDGTVKAWSPGLIAVTGGNFSSGVLGIHEPWSMTWGGRIATPAPSGRARDRAKCPDVARYPSPGRTLCIGCDAPASGFFCPVCEAESDLELSVSALEAEWLRAWHFNPALSSIPPAPAHWTVASENGATVTLSKSEVKTSAPGMTLQDDGLGASPFVDDCELIDIPEFLPRRVSIQVSAASSDITNPSAGA